MSNQTAEERIRSLSEFMAEHEHCDAGFRLVRGAGHDRLAIACAGCATRLDYPGYEEAPAALRGAPREAPVFPIRAATAAATAESSDGGAPPSASSPEPAFVNARRPGGRIPLWLAALVAVISVTAATLVFRWATSSDPATQTAGAPEVQPPGEPERPAPGDQGRGDAGSGAQGSGGEDAKVPLQTIQTGAFTIRAPRPWTGDRVGAAFLYQPRSDAPVGVEILHEDDPGLTLDEVAGFAELLLTERHPDASISDPTESSMAPGALELTARYDQGTEVAIVLAAGDYRYLIRFWIGTRATPGQAHDARRLVRSFQPK